MNYWFRISVKFKGIIIYFLVNNCLIYKYMNKLLINSIVWKK